MRVNKNDLLRYAQETLEKEGIEIPDNTWNGLGSIAQELGCGWSRDLSAGESKVGFVHF